MKNARRLGLLLLAAAAGCGRLVEFPLTGNDAAVSGTDLAAPDLATNDLATVDAPTPDLAPADRPAVLDLPPADLRVPDLKVPDLSVHDQAMVDLVRRDLVVSGDLTRLDLSSPDLRSIDLASLDRGSNDLVSPDLLTAFDLSLADLVSLDQLGSPNDLSPGPDLVMSGPRCHAVVFDGLHAAMTAPAQGYMNPTGAVTVEAWVYPTSYGPQEQVIAGHSADPALSTASYALLLDSTGHPYFALSTLGGDPLTVVSAAVVPLNAWTHVAGVFDPVSTALYIFNGGVMKKSAVIALKPFPINQVPLHIGRYSAASPVERAFFGYIDEVRFSSVARYTVQFTPATTFADNDANSFALYHFDETMGQSCADTTPNANTGLLQQNAMFAIPPVCQ